MKFFFSILAVIGFAVPRQAYLTSNSGMISFYSKAPLENIEARNRKFVVKYNPASGAIGATVLMKGFEFKKALMQEHFNENYVESDKYPKANFEGIVNLRELSLQQNKMYNVTSTGTLTIHGVSNAVTAPGTIVVQDGSISLKAVFSLTLSDYNIRIPAVVRNNISKTVEITVVADGFK